MQWMLVFLLGFFCLLPQHKKESNCQKTRMSVMLRNPVCIVKIEVPAFGKEPYHLVEGIHEAIVSEQLFYSVQEVLSGRKPKRIISRSRSNEHLPLRGILKCSKCGSRLTGSRSKGSKGDLYAYYPCNHCGQDRYRAEKLNETMEKLMNSLQLRSGFDNLLKAISADLLSGEDKGRDTKIRKLKSTVVKQQERLLKLQDNLADGILTSDEYLSMKGRYMSELTEARSELERIEESSGGREQLIKKALLSLNRMGDYYKR